MTEEMIQQSHYRYSAAVIFLVIAAIFHLSMIVSLVSEPYALIHGTNLSGTPTHPHELPEYRGFLDPFFHDTDRVPRGLDFFSIYQSGRNFLRGQSVYYGVRTHHLGAEALVVPYFSGFRYLPAYAFVFGSLLNLLPPWTSYWTWIFVVECMLIFNLYLTKWLPVPLIRRCWIISMWLAYSPYYIELHIGQQSMVTATLIHICIVSHVRHKKIIRDTSYAASVIWKINSILFLPLWIKMGRWKTILTTLLLIVFLSAPYFFLVEESFDEFSSYFHHQFIAAGPNSLGFWTFLTVFLQQANLGHASIRTVLSVWSALVCIYAVLITLLPARIRFINTLSIWICLYFLTYQYVWEHHYVMLLPVITAGMLDDRLRKWTIFLWFCCAIPTPYVLFNDPAHAMPQLTWSFWQTVLYHSTKIIPVFLFFLISSFYHTHPKTRIKSGHDSEQLDFMTFWRKPLGLMQASTGSHSTDLQRESCT